MPTATLRDHADADRRAELAADPSLSQFITQRGKLTVYAFACGYVETSHGLNVRLYRDGGVWHVQDWRLPFRDDDRWQSFETLTEARRAFARRCRVTFSD
jgi:hypothetical protein